jgi:hypothetical protein
MFAKEAVELGIACGLKTVGEAVRNVSYHAPSLFAYEHINDEEDELFRSVERNGLQPETLISEINIDELKE